MISRPDLDSDSRVRFARSFEELLATPFADGVNAVCWPRGLSGDFAEIATLLEGIDEDIVSLDEGRLRALHASPAGRAAIECMVEDMRQLRAHGFAPELNRIRAYPRDDEEPGPVRTDVYSFHADSAPIEAETWLCTYHGMPSEGLRNEEAVRRIDLAETRAALLEQFGGPEGSAFHEHLQEQCYDLHYAPVDGARPFSFGVGNLWRIAVKWPGSKVPPCIHRAPETRPGDAARLLLIS